MFDDVTEYFLQAMYAGLGMVLHRPLLDVPFRDQLRDYLDWQLEGSKAQSKYETISGGPVKPDDSYNYHLAVCYSGGIDSTLAIEYAVRELGYSGKNILALHVDYGAPYAAKENKAVEQSAERLASMGVDIRRVLLNEITIREEDMPHGYIIPMRNSLLAACASKYSANVWIVANYRPNDRSPGSAVDKGRDFYGKITALLSKLRMSPINVQSPFLHLSKRDTIEWFWRNADLSTFQAVMKGTITCYSGGLSRCGTCYACFKTRRAIEGFPLDFGFDRELTQEQELHYVARERAKGRVTHGEA